LNEVRVLYKISGYTFSETQDVLRVGRNRKIFKAVENSLLEEYSDLNWKCFGIGYSKNQ
jgi:hypothetical protein